MNNKLHKLAKELTDKDPCDRMGKCFFCWNRVQFYDDPMAGHAADCAWFLLMLEVKQKDNGTCKTCKWHVPITRRYTTEVDTRGGMCTSRFVCDNLHDNGSELHQSIVYSYEEGGFHWTGNDYGCVHWEVKE